MYLAVEEAEVVAGVEVVVLRFHYRHRVEVAGVVEAL